MDIINRARGKIFEGLTRVASTIHDLRPGMVLSKEKAPLVELLTKATEEGLIKAISEKIKERIRGIRGGEGGEATSEAVVTATETITYATPQKEEKKKKKTDLVIAY